MSPTPIYDQLRGERTNANALTTRTDPQQVDQLGKHRLADGGPGPAVVFARPRTRYSAHEHAVDQSPQNEEAPGLHQSLYQRPRTTVSILGSEPED